MSDIIERAKAALDGVTEGPWVAEFSGEQGNCVIPHDAQSTREAVCTTRLYHQVFDARFIAWARTGVPELVAELEAARAEVERLKGEQVSATYVESVDAHLAEEYVPVYDALAKRHDAAEAERLCEDRS